MAVESVRLDHAAHKRPRGQAAWCLFDWANSPFPTIVGTFLFANYFARAVASDPDEGAGLWALAMGIAGVVTALASPILGAFADQGGARKPWLLAICTVMVAATAGLWFVAPSPDFVILGLVLVVIASAAFELSMVFYNAMLPDIAPQDRIGRISGWGWGLGYAGALAALLICLFVFVQAETPPFGLDKAAQEPIRATNLLVALWFVLFSIPFWRLVPDRKSSGKPARAIVRQGLAQLATTLKSWREHRNIMRYLLAFMLYSNGYNTLFAMGALYAGQTYGMGFSEIIIFAISLNVTAGLGAIVFAWIDDRIGSKPTVMIAVAALGLFGAGALAVDSKIWFWTLTLILSIFFGPAQAASRSLMAHMAPEELRTEMFGLYGLAGRITSFLGTLTVGWVTFATGSFRIGLATVLIFLFAGLWVLWGVRLEEKPAS
ncbi:MAG: MFS transporter [Alphaproteobacteria bacterium]|nr:MFS transporter [Alphaproteobacteria bacterium]